jgi:hypothetical protein
MEYFMARLKRFKGTLTCLALLLVADAFAADKGSLHVSSPENVAGEQLAPGDYTVRWEDTGPSVELRIMQGKKIIATAPAQLIPLGDASVTDAVVVQTHGDGSRSLSRIFLSGKSFAFEIGGEAADMTNNIGK